MFKIGDRVQAGTPGDTWHSTGSVVDIARHGRSEHGGVSAYLVMWWSGVRTWIAADALRPLE